MDARRTRLACSLIVLLAITMAAGVPAVAEDGIVRAVLFHSPTCPHCEVVMTEHLPLLQEQYGERLEILEVDVSQSRGYALYQAAVERFALPEERRGFPLLIIGDRVLLGSREIPSELPGLIATHLAAGGVDWPDIPGLGDFVPTPPAPSLDWRGRLLQDPVGNGLSVAVLAGLLVTLVAVIRPRGWQQELARRADPWGLLAVALVGLAVAGYLARVEVAQQEAFCGPVGDCNAVQRSEYALILGFLPVGVLGMVGYMAILGTLACAWWCSGALARPARAATFLLALFGVLFSTYLTFLEPFVIGATCAWCLTSAVCMALVLVLSAGPGWAALADSPAGSPEVAIGGQDR